MRSMNGPTVRTPTRGGPSSSPAAKPALRLFAGAAGLPKKCLLPAPRLTLVLQGTEPATDVPAVTHTEITTTSRAAVSCEREILATLDQGAAAGERIADAFPCPTRNERRCASSKAKLVARWIECVCSPLASR